MRDIWDIVRDWLMGTDDRRMEFSHGGEGGKWYCVLREDGQDDFDGAGHTHSEALIEAWGSLTNATHD